MWYTFSDDELIHFSAENLTSSGCPKKSLYEICAVEWSLPAQTEKFLATSAQQCLNWSIPENEKQQKDFVL